VAPLGDSSRDYIKKTLSRVEGIPIEALDAGAPWDWTSTADYLGRIDGRLGVNAGFMVGHTAVRRLVMGDDATQRYATEHELDAMSALVRDGLGAGCLGFSTSRGQAHQDSEGDPVPSRHAHPDELVALA